MRDHSPLVVDNFRGNFDRGEDESCSPGFFLSSYNLEFIKNGVQTRDGTIKENLAAQIPANIHVRRMELYERIGESQRLLILDDTGKIWDSITGVVILSIPSMTDFSCTVMFDRAFITPHNGQVGLPGEKVYLYEGSGTARPAAGSGPPAEPGMGASEPDLSGKIEAGVHYYGVAFETASGYISQIGGFVAIESTGEKVIQLTAIPIGPPGTTARILYATKLIDGENLVDARSYTWYTVPDGRISDNTAVTTNVSFYDADLMDDASFLLEQLSEIPAGVGIGQYKGRLIIWGENASSAVVRVSQPGEPENHNGADGFLTVYPGIGGGVKNCVEYRNVLIIAKSHRAYSTNDNDDVPATWDIGEVDGAVGTECHGIGQILNIGSNVEDKLFVVDRSGLRVFTGTFAADEMVITYNIDDVWSRITKSAFHNVEASVDAINAKLYIAVPLDGALTPTHLLYGDYSEGLGEDSIRWTIWKFPTRPTSIVLSLIDGTPTLKIGSIDGYVYRMVPDYLLDNGQLIECSMKFPLYPVGSVDEQINHYTGIRLRARGVGNLDIALEGLDGSNAKQAQSLVLAEKPGVPYFRGFDFTSEHCSVTLTLTQPASWVVITKFILYLSPVWESRAQVG